MLAGIKRGYTNKKKRWDVNWTAYFGVQESFATKSISSHCRLMSLLMTLTLMITNFIRQVFKVDQVVVYLFCVQFHVFCSCIIDVGLSLFYIIIFTSIFIYLLRDRQKKIWGQIYCNMNAILSHLKKILYIIIYINLLLKNHTK